MASVKELKAQAKAAGLTGYSNLKKGELEALLADAGAPADDEAAAEAVPVGVPTEPEKANLTETEEQGLAIIGGRPTRPAFAGAGIPTEPERGGVTAKDVNAEGAFEPAAPAKPSAAPSITGNDGKITEPKRGGTNLLEQALEGVTKASP